MLDGEPVTAPMSIIPSTPMLKTPERSKTARRAPRTAAATRRRRRPPGRRRTIRDHRAVLVSGDGLLRRPVDDPRVAARSFGGVAEHREQDQPCITPTSPEGKSAGPGGCTRRSRARRAGRRRAHRERVVARERGDDDPGVAVVGLLEPFARRAWRKSPIWLAPPIPAMAPERHRTATIFRRVASPRTARRAASRRSPAPRTRTRARVEHPRRRRRRRDEEPERDHEPADRADRPGRRLGEVLDRGSCPVADVSRQ